MRYFMLIAVLCLTACASTRPVEAEKVHLLGAIAVNASACHVPPVIVTFNSDGLHETWDKKTVTPELLAKIKALPESHIATVMVPCGDAEESSEEQPSPHKVGCDSDWAESNPGLWRDTHCSNISLLRTDWFGVGGWIPLDDALPDGTKPMSPEHRKQSDPQSRSDWRGKTGPGEHKWCDGHVKQFIEYPDGGFLITCLSAKEQGQ